MEILAFLLAGLFILLGFVLGGNFIINRWHRRWLAHVAKRVGGRLHDGSWLELPEMTLRCGYFGARVTFEGDGKASSQTVFRIPWIEEQLRCEVRQRGVIEGLLRLPNEQPIEMAAPLLDAGYVVTGNEELKIRRLFSARVQSALIQLARLAPVPYRKHPDVHMVIEDGLVTITKASHIVDEPTVEQFIRLCAELHDAALHELSSAVARSVVPPSKSCA